MANGRSHLQKLTQSWDLNRILLPSIADANLAETISQPQAQAQRAVLQTIQYGKSECSAFILQEVHMNLVHIQLQYAGRLAEAQQASQMGLCAAFVTVHKLLYVCPSLRHSNTSFAQYRRISHSSASCFLLQTP